MVPISSYRLRLPHTGFSGADGEKAGWPYRLSLFIVLVVNVLLSALPAHSMSQIPLPPPGSERYDHFTINELILKSDSSVKCRDLNSSMDFLTIVVSRDNDNLSQEDLESVILAYSNLGYMWLCERHNPMRAYPLLIRGLELAGQIPNNTREERVYPALYNNLGHLYMAYNDTPNALHYLCESFREAIRLKDEEAVITSFVDLAHGAWLCDSLNIMREPLERFFEYKGRFIWLNTYSRYIGSAVGHYLKNEPDIALEKVQEAFRSIDIDIFRGRYEALNRLICAKTALKLNNIKVAREALQFADSVIVREQLIDLTDKLYAIEADFYRLTGNEEEAAKHLLKALAMRDSLFNAQQYRMVLDIKAAWDASNQQRQLALAKSESSKRQTTIVVLSLWATFLIIGAVVIFLQNKKLKRSNRELFNKNMQLINEEKPEKAAFDGVIGPDGGSSSEASSEVGTSDETSSSASASELKAVFATVKEFMTTSSDIFDPDFSVEALASATKMRVRSISHAIHTFTGKNFSAYLAEIRIREACRILLADSGSGRPTIEVVAEQVGYRSRSHFSRVFKTVTGFTTTEFLREAT